MSRAWRSTVAALSDVTQQLCAYLRTGIAQTLEASHQVVGFDTAWEVAPVCGMGPARLVTHDLSEGLCVGPSRCVFLARTTTKDASWLIDVPSCVSLEPRVTHRGLDVRAAPERVASLIQWWVRFCDGFWRGDCPEGPPRERRAGDPGWMAQDRTESAQWWWHGQVIDGMLRELIANGWARVDVSRSLYRARASTQARCQTPDIRRRDRFLAWVLHSVSQRWDALKVGVTRSLSSQPARMMA